MTHVARDWFADESFWSTFFPSMFPPEAFPRAHEEVEGVLHLTGCRAGSVLDLACGPARHAVPLAKRGFRVTAVDRSRFLLDKAAAYAADENVTVDFVEADMRAFRTEETYDLALSLFTSFGFFTDPTENETVLANVHDALRPGGCLVLDVLGKELVARDYQPAAVTELPDGALVIQRRTVVDDWSRIENHWLFVRGDTVRSHRFTIWIYSARELRGMLEQAGFASAALYGGLDGSPYGPAAKRLVAVARKAG